MAGRIERERETDNIYCQEDISGSERCGKKTGERGRNRKSRTHTVLSIIQLSRLSDFVRFVLPQTRMAVKPGGGTYSLYSAMFTHKGERGPSVSP